MPIKIADFFQVAIVQFLLQKLYTQCCKATKNAEHTLHVTLLRSRFCYWSPALTLGRILVAFVADRSAREFGVRRHTILSRLGTEHITYRKNSMWIRSIIFISCIGLIIIYHLFPNIINIVQVLRVDEFTLSLFIVAVGTLCWNQLVSLVRGARKIEKRFIVFGLCVILVIIGLLSPTMKIDTNAIWLIGIAAVVYILPNLQSLMLYVKKIRIGDAELELREDINTLEKEVEKAEGAAVEQGVGTTSKDAERKATSDVEKILEEAAKSPRAALLLLSAKIEDQLRQVLERAGIDYQRPSSLTRLVELGVKYKAFPQEILSAIRDFSSVRNRIAHGVAFDIDDSYVLSIISLGTQLLNVLSTIEPSIPVSSTALSTGNEQYSIHDGEE